MRIAPPPIIARLGAEVLAVLAARPTDPATLDAWERATGKAIERLIAAVAFTEAGDHITFASWSRGGTVQHCAGPAGCTCEAGRTQVPCWHRMARTIIRRQRRAEQRAATEAGALLPAPTHCHHCGHAMHHTTTPGGEPCLECSNAACQWTVMAAATVPAPRRAA